MTLDCHQSRAPGSILYHFERFAASRFTRARGSGKISACHTSLGPAAKLAEPEQLARLFALGLSTAAELSSQRRKIDHVSHTQHEVVQQVTQIFYLDRRREAKLRSVVSHYLAHPLASYASGYLLTRLEDYLRTQGGEIDCAEFATSEAAQNAIIGYLRGQIRNLKSSYRKCTYRSSVDAMVIGDRETAKRSELVQGHFAHCCLVAHHLIMNPAPQSTKDTAFWRTITSDIKHNVDMWGSDHNSPGWRK
ncbi:hypothetical protein PENSPDRAFT_694878 [Peniophora sp. CONT]|nr:hypothetical protein PENSPDRAFT_694878 [Peniophora sp. CONT]